VPPGSFAELSRQKIVFDLQLANLTVQNINLCGAGRILRCSAAAFENAPRAIQQLLLPGADLVRVNPVRARQLGDRPLALIAASATLALNAAPCFLLVCFMSCSRAIGAS